MFEVQEEAECIVREGDLEFYRAWADCQQIKKGKINLTPTVKSDLVAYGFYYLEMELHKYATMHHFDYSRLALHDFVSDKKRSWGTCHYYERAISLNLNLLFTSMEFIKVVILHELVH